MWKTRMRGLPFSTSSLPSVSLVGRGNAAWANVVCNIKVTYVRDETNV